MLISDGEGHEEESDALAAARTASNQRVRLYVLGVGSGRGEPIPRHDELGEKIGGYKRDGAGEVVLSRLAKEPLATAARIGDGFWARVDEGGGSRVLAALSELRRGRGEVAYGVRWTARFQWFVGLALVLLMADWVWAWRRVR